VGYGSDRPAFRLGWSLSTISIAMPVGDQRQMKEASLRPAERQCPR
jgi:hypothetical protein